LGKKGKKNKPRIDADLTTGEKREGGGSAAACKPQSYRREEESIIIHLGKHRPLEAERGKRKKRVKIYPIPSQRLERNKGTTLPLREGGHTTSGEEGKEKKTLFHIAVGG